MWTYVVFSNNLIHTIISVESKINISVSLRTRNFILLYSVPIWSDRTEAHFNEIQVFQNESSEHNSKCATVRSKRSNSQRFPIVHCDRLHICIYKKKKLSTNFFNHSNFPSSVNHLRYVDFTVKKKCHYHNVQVTKFSGKL